jgi:hypothetical protein
MAEFNELPEGCIAAILSHTTPIDACRFSLISKTFCSAADSNAVWNRFLPSDPNFIDSIISHSPSLANIPSKKDLYLGTALLLFHFSEKKHRTDCVMQCPVLFCGNLCFVERSRAQIQGSDNEPQNRRLFAGHAADKYASIQAPANGAQDAFA